MSPCALELATEGNQRHLDLNHVELEVLRRAIDRALQTAAAPAAAEGIDPTAAAAVAFFGSYKLSFSRERIPFHDGAVTLDEADAQALFQAVALYLRDTGGERGRRSGRLPATTLLAKLSRATG